MSHDPPPMSHDPPPIFPKAVATEDVANTTVEGLPAPRQSTEDSLDEARRSGASLESLGVTFDEPGRSASGEFLSSPDALLQQRQGSDESIAVAFTSANSEQSYQLAPSQTTSSGTIPQMDSQADLAKQTDSPKQPDSAKRSDSSQRTFSSEPTGAVPARASHRSDACQSDFSGEPKAADLSQREFASLVADLVTSRVDSLLSKALAASHDELTYRLQGIEQALQAATPPSSRRVSTHLHAAPKKGHPARQHLGTLDAPARQHLGTLDEVKGKNNARRASNVSSFSAMPNMAMTSKPSLQSNIASEPGDSTGVGDFQRRASEHSMCAGWAPAHSSSSIVPNNMIRLVPKDTPNNSLTPSSLDEFASKRPAKRHSIMSFSLGASPPAVTRIDSMNAPTRVISPTVTRLGNDIADQLLGEFLPLPMSASTSLNSSSQSPGSSYLSRRGSEDSVVPSDIGSFCPNSADSDEGPRRSGSNDSDMLALGRRNINSIVDGLVPRSSIKTKELSLASLRFLRLCGITPWSSTWLADPRRIWLRPSVWYQWIILLLSGLCCAVSVDAVMGPVYESSDIPCILSSCHESAMFSDIPIAVGSFLGLLMMCYQRSSLVVTFHILQSYANAENFVIRWFGMMRLDMVITIFVWFLAVAERIRGTYAVSGSLSDHEILRIVSFAFSSLILCALAHCILCFCSGMMCAVDSYCVAVLHEDGLSSYPVPRWNRVQAMLRKISATATVALVVLQAAVLFAFMFGVFDVYQSLQQGTVRVILLIPFGIMAIAIARVFFKAATVTDMCTRVPSLINSCHYGSDFDVDRQYIVEYVQNSTAGFYFFETRLTSDMTLKFTYILTVAMFAVLTQLLG